MTERESPGVPEAAMGAIRAHREEPLDGAIRRIILGQYDILIDALSHIEDVDSSIHTARKAMKRLRGLFRLNRDPSSREQHRSENVVLRDVARELAPVRDSYVLIATLDSITEDIPGRLDINSMSAAREIVRANYEHQKRVALASDEHFSGAIVALSASRRRVEESPLRKFPSGSGADEFSLIREGLRRTYRSGRRAYKRACREGTSEAYHRWRKPIKYLRHQVELISEPVCGPLNRLAEDLSELGDILGLDHDLDVLAGLLVGQYEATPDDPTIEELLDAIVGRSTQYRTGALGTGSDVFAESPEDFVALAHTYWIADQI